MQCQACLTPLQETDNYCAQCGAASGLELREKELKLVTVLRGDIVGSTELVAGLDPEGAMLRTEPCMVAMRAAIRRFGGAVTRELGDGVQAVFGAPLAHESHATLACHAALDLVRGVEALGDPTLKVRVGLHSGVVVAAHQRTAGSFNLSLDGPVLNLVERLQEQAQPNTIFASQACRELAEGFIQFEAKPAVRLRGFSSPVPVHCVRSVGHLSSWPVRSARSFAAFVGRQREMQILHRLVEETTNDGGRTVAMVGLPGVGKSRMVHELVSELRERGWNVLEGYCSPTQQNAPYGALRTLLHAGLQTSREDVGRDALAGLSQLWRAALDMVLELQVEDEEWLRLEPRARSRTIVDASMGFFSQLATRRSTAIVMEDMHWLDNASNGAIEALVSLARCQQILVILTSRPDDRPAWTIGDTISEMQVAPLDRGSARRLLEALLKEYRISDEFKDQVLRHTGNVPLFIEEVCRGFRSSRAQGAIGELHAALPLDLDVPPTVQGVIASRVDRLSKVERSVLQYASAIGPRPSLALLRAVVGLTNTELQMDLQALADAELLLEEPAETHLVLSFAHDLIRQVTYDSMLRSTKQRLHRAVLSALEADSAARTDDALCYHAVRAAEWAKSRIYALRVARTCLSTSNLADAAHYFGIAMDAIDRLIESPQRERDAIDVRLEARAAFASIGQVNQWLTLAHEAERRAEAIGDASRKVASMAVRAAGMNFASTPFEAVAAGVRATEEAMAAGDPGWLSYVQYGLGQAYYISGQFRDAERTLQAACLQLDRHDAKAPAGATPQYLLMLCCMMKSISHLTLGEVREADTFRKRALEMAANSTRPIDHISAAYSNGMYLFQHGDLDAAERCLAAALDASRQHEVNLFTPVIGCQLGIVLIERNNRARAHDVLARACRDGETLGHTFVVLRSTIHLARAGAAEQWQDMAGLARAARDRARQQGFQHLEAEALLAEAEILVPASPRNATAVTELIRLSAAIGERLGTRPHVAKCMQLQREFSGQAARPG